MMKTLPLDEHTAAHVADLFSAFSDTTRVRIISAIIEQEMKISDLSELFGLTESAISHHMRGLRHLKIVQARRDGKEIFYSIVDPHLIALFRQGIDHVKE
jgi:ArsR family transcriptional regulator